MPAGAAPRVVNTWWASARWRGPQGLSGRLSVDEVFTTMTGAPRGGGRAGWDDEVLTPTSGDCGGSFGDGVSATGSSSVGDDGGSDVLEHREAN
jgi:hypothetical protein